MTKWNKFIAICNLCVCVCLCKFCKPCQCMSCDAKLIVWQSSCTNHKKKIVFGIGSVFLFYSPQIVHRSNCCIGTLCRNLHIWRRIEWREGVKGSLLLFSFLGERWKQSRQSILHISFFLINQNKTFAHTHTCTRSWIHQTKDEPTRNGTDRQQ